MPSPYPYIASQRCEKCGNQIVVKQKRDINNQFCSRECYSQYRRKDSVIKLNLSSEYTCLKCNKLFKPCRNTKGMYCSYACSNGVKSVRHKLKCKSCGVEFEINNIAEINRGHYRYCSNECRQRKYQLNERFFDAINSNTCYWLGFIWSTILYSTYNQVYIVSKKDLLERFNNEINSNYPIRKYKTTNKYFLLITSLTMLNRLVDIGLKDSLYLEFPDIVPLEYIKDFIRGYFDSDYGYHYKDCGKDVVALHGKSSKLMKCMSQYLNSELVMNKGEFVSISFDFKNIDGYPRLDSKWEKFNKI